MNFALAVKGFVVKDGKFLTIKRRSNDVHNPNAWDLPGGRLNPGEDPFLGLQRETKEEVALDIAITAPLDVHHFVREDGQTITMIIFLCKPTSETITLSEEHQEYQWMSVDANENDVPAWIWRVLEKYRAYSHS